MTCKNCGCSQPLNDIMEPDHVIAVDEDGHITEPSGIYAPELEMGTDGDGQILDEHEAAYKADAARQGWQILEGFTGQHAYRGPVMHPSEFVGGGLEDHIRETPGSYAVVIVRCDDGEDAGWAVAYRPPPEHADYPHEPGRLSDCPACEASCHCTAGHTECVFEGEHNGLADDGTERHETAEPWPAAGTVQVKRDGVVQETFAGPDPVQNSNDAFAWLLRNQGQSVDWAIRHEGWEITEPIC
jgi:hypothetical protein